MPWSGPPLQARIPTGAGPRGRCPRLEWPGPFRPSQPPRRQGLSSTTVATAGKPAHPLAISKTGYSFIEPALTFSDALQQVSRDALDARIFAAEIGSRRIHRAGRTGEKHIPPAGGGIENEVAPGCRVDH